MDSVEGGIAGGLRSTKSGHQIEAAVEHIDGSITEVRGVKGWPASLAIRQRNPLYTEFVVGSDDEGLIIRVAFKRSTAGFQPQIPPSSPSKRNMAGLVGGEIKNAFVAGLLKTIPVGAAGGRRSRCVDKGRRKRHEILAS